MEILSNVADVSLVLEGGGMRGSYTAGIVTALLDAHLYFDHVSGISAGCSNLANYLSRDRARTRRSFVDLAMDPAFGNTYSWLRGQGLFNAEYLYEHTGLPGGSLPFDWDTFATNPARYRIGAFRCDDGAAVSWERSDAPDLPALMKRVRASSTMPVVMPTTYIDGVAYVDGALGPSGGIPLDLAQTDGMDRFLVVLTQPAGFVKHPSKHQRAFDMYFRRYPAVAEAMRTRHERYNRTREELLDLERDGKALVVYPEQLTAANGTRHVPTLAKNFTAGLAQARRELPRWKEFCGL